MASSTALPDSLAALLDAKDYYSFHQKLRTSSARTLAAPRRRAPGASPSVAVDGHQPFDEKAKETAALLWEGARRLLEQGQLGSGVDVAGLLVDVWKSRGVECGPEERCKLAVSSAGALPCRLSASRLKHEARAGP